MTSKSITDQILRDFSVEGNGFFNFRSKRKGSMLWDFAHQCSTSRVYTLGYEKKGGKLTVYVGGFGDIVTDEDDKHRIVERLLQIDLERSRLDSAFRKKAREEFIDNVFSDFAVSCADHGSSLA